jgi:biotin carboxyl carrier protein
MQQSQQPALPQQAVGMPAVIPVQPNNTYRYNQPTTAPANNSNVTVVDDRIVSQLQADYMQKINSMSEQNKALQDQMQALNTRVATMETQLNQVVQMLMQEQRQATAPPAAAAPPASPAPEVKSIYSVQAIIPGRAWLRSDSGETVTVAEGDVIKELGRVTKIDPYDGIVEVNTGSKVISLSYGSGG